MNNRFFARSVLGAALAFSATYSANTLAESINVYNWSEYIPMELVQQFTEETGIKVNYSTYDSNEAMFARVKLLEGKGYDLVFPSSYYVQKMAQEQLLLPIDKSKLSNLANLDPQLMDTPYDPGNQYSVPFMWGNTAIIANTDYIDADSVSSWASLWEDDWQGALQLPNDVREVFQIALNRLGYPANTEDPKQIEEAYELLRELMPNVQSFNSDGQRLAFLTGDVELGVGWNAEVWMAQEEDPAVKLIYPEEGAIFWVDAMSIPSGAENIDGAHKFIDFILRADVAKVLVEEIGYSTPNIAVLPLLDEETRNNPIVFPPAEVMEKGQFQGAVSDETIALYEQYWQRLKNAAD